MVTVSGTNLIWWFTFNPCNFLVWVSIETTLLPLSIYLQSDEVYSEVRTCPNLQMWFNSEPTTTEVYSFPNCLAMLLRQLILRQLVRDFSTTFQMYKCGLKVRQTTATECFDDRTWLILRTKKFLEETTNFSHQRTNFDFRSQAQTELSKPIRDCLKCIPTDVPAIKFLTEQGRRTRF